MGLNHSQSVQKCKSSIILTLCGKFDVWIYKELGWSVHSRNVQAISTIPERFLIGMDIIYIAEPPHGLVGAVSMANYSKCSMNKLHTIGDTGDPVAAAWTC